ncbi:uncharacterized protein METZ01_LOCUS109556 [marine metagenome]|uniref:Co-chaperone DjlA N-terminal domain-containing protein n=1 Tax=marine metagenome TaxID=408172 RepID=A0A381WWJ1_9ZZZZ
MLFVEYIKLFKHGLLLNSFYYSNNQHMMDFFNFFKSKKPEESGELSPNPIQMATAVLLIEMARADFDQAENENEVIKQLLKGHFDLNNRQTDDLFDEAVSVADDAVSLHEYTHALHKTLTQEAKEEVIEMLWRLAMSDDNLDKHEDYLVRKIADLLYVPNSIVLKMRHKVTSE